MEDTSSFFIPQRKRKVKTRVQKKEDEEDENNPKYLYRDGVLILDKKESLSTSLSTSDVEFGCASSIEALEKKKENALASALWAINVYLEPDVVMHCTIYWLSQYVNYKLPESEWFNDHINGLMLNPARLTASSSQGIAYIHARLPKHTLLLHIAGSNLHKLPNEYFVHNDCIEMLECQTHLLESAKECFLTKNTYGLKAELELSTFVYNNVLSYFYEPSFHIITSYLLYVHKLVSIPHGRHLWSFLPRIKHIAKPIEHGRIPWDKLHCLNRANSNYTEKRQVFEQDLIELSLALSHLQVDQVLEAVTALWSKKATYVTEQIDVRYNAIYDQLY